jgi:hypothetical protein
VRLRPDTPPTSPPRRSRRPAPHLPRTNRRGPWRERYFLNFERPATCNLALTQFPPLLSLLSPQPDFGVSIALSLPRTPKQQLRATPPHQTPNTTTNSPTKWSRPLSQVPLEALDRCASNLTAPRCPTDNRQPLSLLLKSCQLVDELALYDVVNAPGVATDLSHISSPAVRADPNLTYTRNQTLNAARK